MTYGGCKLLSALTCSKEQNERELTDGGKRRRKEEGEDEEGKKKKREREREGNPFYRG